MKGRGNYLLFNRPFGRRMAVFVMETKRERNKNKK